MPLLEPAGSHCSRSTVHSWPEDGAVGDPRSNRMVSVDVAIPNYNYGRYLRGCVESVLSQDIEALRVLIIDNASTDNSAEIARELARSDPRVEIRIREKNLGPHASFNEAVDWAAGDYFLILCSDDAVTPGSLRRAA